MPKPPLIHIGYAKTGTTWLQSGLFGSNSFGFHPVGGAAKTFGARFVYGEPGGPRTPLDFEPDALRQAYEMLMTGQSGCPVISNEALLSHPFSAGIQVRDICFKLKEVFPDARIVITLREQRSMIVSLYEHYLRKGGASSLQDFMADKGHQSLFPLFDKSYLEYDKCIRLYRETFGKGSVLVLPFEWIASDTRHFLSRLYEFSGASPEGLERFLTGEKHKAQNVSSPAYAAAQYRFRVLNLLGNPSSYNGFNAIGYKRLSRALFRSIAALTPAGSAAAYRKDIFAKVDALLGDAYLESNRRTQELTGLDLAALDYSA
jgi:hypothetical protein